MGWMIVMSIVFITDMTKYVVMVKYIFSLRNNKTHYYTFPKIT